MAPSLLYDNRDESSPLLEKFDS